MPIDGLTIRAEQFRILEEDLVFRWIVEYLEASYPERAREYGAQFTSLVRNAFRRARARQITAPQDLRKFVHVNFTLGPDFPDAPKFALLKRILDDPKYHNTTVRLRALEDAALAHLSGSKVS